MKTWKKILLEIGIFTAVFALGAGGGFLAAYSNPQKQKVDENVALTNSTSQTNTPNYVPTSKDKFLSSLSSAQAVYGDIDLKIEKINNEPIAPMPTRALDLNDFGDVDLSLKNLNVDFSNLSDLKLEADLSVKTEDLDLSLSLAYVDNTIFLDYEDTHWYLKTSDLLEGILMIPCVGSSIASLLNSQESDVSFDLDIDALTSSLNSIEEFNENDKHYFLFNLTPEISIRFNVDENLNMSGVELPGIEIGGYRISATSTIKTSSEKREIISPINKPDAPKYTNFKSAFTLAADVMRIIKLKQAHVGLDLEVLKAGESGLESFIDVNGELDFDAHDLSNLLLNSSLTISESGRKHNIEAAFSNNTVFARYKNFYSENNDLSISIEKQSIESLVEIITTKFPMEETPAILEGLGDFALEMDLRTILKIVNDVPTFIDEFELNNNHLSFYIDTSYFNLSLGKVYLRIDFDSIAIKSITVSGLRIDDMLINLTLDVSEYVDFTINESSYLRLDPAVGMIDNISELIEKDNFGIDFNIDVLDNEDANKNLYLNGEFQFTLSGSFMDKTRNFDLGAGYLNIKETNVLHKINAYAIDNGDIRLKYDMRELINGSEVSDNNHIYASFNRNMVDSLVGTISKLMNGEASNAVSMINSFMDNSDELPISRLINGDFGVLFDTKILNSLDVSEDTIVLGLNGAIINLEATDFELMVHFANDTVDNIALTGFEFGGKTINMSANLHNFDENSFNSYKNLLPDNASYLDISSVATLLDIGINTTEFNYYKITGTANINITAEFFGSQVSLKTVSVPITLEILNENNHVKVLAKFEVPFVSQFVVVGNYGLTTGPTSYLMYDSETECLYTSRNDTKKSGYYLFSASNSSAKYYRRCTVDYAMENIFDILLKDILGLADFITDMVAGAGGAEEHQIHYDNLIDNYSCSNGVYNLSLNLAELAGNEKMGTLGLTVIEGKHIEYSENEVDELGNPVIVVNKDIMSKIEASFNMNLALNFNMFGSLNIQLSDCDTEYEGHSLDYFDNWVSKHQNDELNKQFQA